MDSLVIMAAIVRRMGLAGGSGAAQDPLTHRTRHVHGDAPVTLSHHVQP